MGIGPLVGHVIEETNDLGHDEAEKSRSVPAERRREAHAPLPSYIAETVAELADLHAAHQDTASRSERVIRATTNRVGRPSFLIIFLATVAAWIAGNGVAMHWGMAVDAPQFTYLELAATLIGVALTVLILVTQQRNDALAERREQLTLELAVISDQKSAKIIALLEELRRDLPMVENRGDSVASEMATPDNPASILDAIRSSHGATQTGVDEPSRD